MKTALAAACVMLAACNPQPNQNRGAATPIPSSTAMPPLTVTGHGAGKRPAVFFGQSGNRKLYQIEAQSYSSRSAQSTAQATFKEPTVTFYDKDGTKMTARAPVATLVGDTVTLSGGVRAATDSGLTLTCDRLAYDKSSGMLHGFGHVRITGMQGGQRQVLTGNAFTSDVRLTHMVMR
jgi:LPS export ABC transporter protein LptC